MDHSTAGTSQAAANVRAVCTEEVHDELQKFKDALFLRVKAQLDEQATRLHNLEAQNNALRAENRALVADMNRCPHSNEIAKHIITKDVANLTVACSQLATEALELRYEVDKLREVQFASAETSLSLNRQMKGFGNGYELAEIDSRLQEYVQ